MKLFPLTLLFITIFAIRANAQQPTLSKPGIEIAKKLHEGRITGMMTYPKTITETDFVNRVKANTKLFSYKIVNGQLTDKSPITITSMKVLNVTRNDSPNYMYTYEINAVFPFDQPVDVAITDWEFAFAKLIVFEKVSANEYATLSLADKVYAGFDFKGKFVPHPH
jgi:hypothetical protein